MYNEKTIYKKAKDVGYEVSKGFVHYHTGCIFRYQNGDREVGYNVIDTSNNSLVWGCYSQMFDHQWSLADVDDFIRSVYEANGLAY